MYCLVCKWQGDHFAQQYIWNETSFLHIRFDSFWFKINRINIWFLVLFNSSIPCQRMESCIIGYVCERGWVPTSAQTQQRLEGQQLPALFANRVLLWSRLIRKHIACDWKERESHKWGQGLHNMNIGFSLAKSRSSVVNKSINLSTCLQIWHLL